VEKHRETLKVKSSPREGAEGSNYNSDAGEKWRITKS
jgi:hypothetical protein